MDQSSKERRETSPSKSEKEVSCLPPVGYRRSNVEKSSSPVVHVDRIDLGFRLEDALS